MGVGLGSGPSLAKGKKKSREPRTHKDFWKEHRGRVAVTHRAAGLVVVLVHGRARVWPVLARIRELPGHQHTEVSVLAAAAPLPALARRPLMMGIAAADGGGALGAGASDCEGHASRSDGVHEGRFAGGCGKGVGRHCSDKVLRCSRPASTSPAGKEGSPSLREVGGTEVPFRSSLAGPAPGGYPHFGDEQTEAQGG